MFNNGLYPTMSYGSKATMFSALKKINWGNFLTNAQKTLGVINQAIPIAYQIKPIWNNTKTIFKIMGAIKDDGKPTKPTKTNRQYTPVNTNNTNIKRSINNQPNFFL